MEFTLNDVVQFMPSLIKAAGMTILISLLAMIFAMIIGVFVDVARTSKIRVIYIASSIYVDFIRGTPLLLQLFYIYYVLPLLGMDIPAFEAGIIGLALNYGAYLSEVFRAGIEAIPKGQIEAASALGLKGVSIMRLVVIPQAFRIVIPPVGNYFIALFKDSSLVSIIGITELLRAGQLLAASTYQHFAIYTMVGLIYLLISYPAALGVGWLQRRLSSMPVGREPNVAAGIIPPSAGRNESVT